MSYQQKYLKYKAKYLELVKLNKVHTMSGGALTNSDCNKVKKWVDNLRINGKPLTQEITEEEFDDFFKNQPVSSIFKILSVEDIIDCLKRLSIPLNAVSAAQKTKVLLPQKPLPSSIDKNCKFIELWAKNLEGTNISNRDIKNLSLKNSQGFTEESIRNCLTILEPKLSALGKTIESAVVSVKPVSSSSIIKPPSTGFGASVSSVKVPLDPNCIIVSNYMISNGIIDNITLEQYNKLKNIWKVSNKKPDDLDKCLKDLIPGFTIPSASTSLTPVPSVLPVTLPVPVTGPGKKFKPSKNACISVKNWVDTLSGTPITQQMINDYIPTQKGLKLTKDEIEDCLTHLKVNFEKSSTATILSAFGLPTLSTVSPSPPPASALLPPSVFTLPAAAISTKKNCSANFPHFPDEASKYCDGKTLKSEIVNKLQPSNNTDCKEQRDKKEKQLLEMCNLTPTTAVTSEDFPLRLLPNITTEPISTPTNIPTLDPKTIITRISSTYNNLNRCRQ
jgi:hypothetical protein